MSQESNTQNRPSMFELMVAYETLGRLDMGGVDNWDWYSESLNPEGEESYVEMVERLKKEFGEK